MNRYFIKEELLTEITTTWEVKVRKGYKDKEYNSVHLYCGLTDSNTFPFAYFLTDISPDFIGICAN